MKSPVHSLAAMPLFLLMVAVLLRPSAAFADDGGRESLRLLTIGNSFANDSLNGMLPIVKAADKKLVVFRANIGGCSLERHARHLREARAGEDAGRAYKNVVDPTTGESGDFTLPEALALLPWDVVTIQQVSTGSFRRETFQPHADELIAAIREFAPGAEIVIHQTWAYRDDHEFFRKGDGFTPAKMHEGLRENYAWLAAEKGLRILPVGEAMHLARQTPRWSYVVDPGYDFTHPPEGALPEQHGSLHVGWRWTSHRETGVRSLQLDAIHANAAGRYLGGVVWYRALYGTDRVPDDYVPEGLTAEDAADLRGHAAAALAAQAAAIVLK